MALRDLGANFTHYRLVEHDKYPVASYNAIHGTSFEPMDITNVTGEDLGIVDTDKYEYIMTYSFPCQDLSVAGKMKGMTKGTGTRSGLLWEVERLLNEVENLPQILLMENVKQVIGKGNKDDFVLWCKFLESKGYTNHWKVLNAKDYGVAQNRERCFMVSILGDYDYEFSAPIPLTKTMKDYLDEVVDEKYYINNERVMELINKVKNGVKCTLPTEPHQAHCAIGGRDGRSLEWKEYSPCLCARDYKDPKVVSVPEIEKILDIPKEILKDSEKNRRVYGKTGISPTLMARSDSPKIAAKRIGNIYGDDKGTGFAGNVWDNNSVLPTLTTMQGGNRQPMTIYNYRIRKLTPLECWRLMGFSDDDFNKAATVNSNTQLYKQAGNSIVKDVLMAIFGKLIK